MSFSTILTQSSIVMEPEVLINLENHLWFILY